MGKKILHLTLKRKWFQMILSGEKKEEYREIKPYWLNRLFNINPTTVWEFEDMEELSNELRRGHVMVTPFKKYDIIRFTNGYGKDAPTFDIECKGIRIGEGNSAWGGSGTTFIISLGNIII